MNQIFYIVEVRVDTKTIYGNLFLGSSISQVERFIANNLDFPDDEDVKNDAGKEWYFAVTNMVPDFDIYTDPLPENTEKYQNAGCTDYYYSKEGKRLEEQPI